MTKDEKQDILCNNWNKLVTTNTNIKQRTIVCPTGFGKTRLGIKIINRILSKKQDRHIFISVPNETTYNTWKKNLELYVNSNFIANNITLETAGTTINNKQNREYFLIIIDEIHKYTSDNRIEILKNHIVNFNYGLGLTGTNNNETNKYFPTDNSISVSEKEAIDNNWISNYVEYNLSIELTEEDRSKYEVYSEHINNMMHLFKNDYDLIQHCYSGSKKDGIPGDVFRQQVAERYGWTKDLDNSNPYDAEVIKYWSPGAIYDKCKLFNDYVQKRNELINNNNLKLSTSLDLYVKLGNTRKTIIFSQSTAMADKICHNINEYNIKQNCISDKDYYPIIVSYHSNIISRPLIDTSTGEFVKVKSTGKVKMFGQTYFKKDAIDGISTGRYKAISTCNTLNESLDVEDISFVITTGGTINPLTHTQRTGRSKRFVKDKVSIIVNVYFKNTRDEQKLKQRQILNNLEPLYINSISEISYSE